MKLYGAAELAKQVGVASCTVSAWLASGKYGIPEPDVRLKCGPIWKDSARLRRWFEKMENGNGPRRKKK